MNEESSSEIRRRHRVNHPDQIDSRMDCVRIVKGPPREIKEIREMDRIAADIRLQREKK
jgi:hypothetical protein